VLAKRAAFIVGVCLIWQAAALEPKAADKRDVIAELDLGAGSLSQSNCKTAVGCGHPHVVLEKGSLTSIDTQASLAQHILMLELKGPFDGVGRGARTLELVYELSNPSGHRNNQICASALVQDHLVQRCSNPYATSGRLFVPLQSVPETIAFHFALMPMSAGHRFVIRNVRLVPGLGKANALDDKDKLDQMDLTEGRLRQTGCATPIGCAHQSVKLTPDGVSSIVSGIGGPPKPTDNPNQPPGDNPPPAVLRKLSLELPVPAKGRKLRSLHFSYRMESADAQKPGGGQIVVTARGQTALESVIDMPGSGLAAIDFPETSLPIESITVAFVPKAGVGPTRFEVSGVGLGPRAPAGADMIPAADGLTCLGCDPPASRLDPCGQFLNTFWVSAVDSREGRGIRCVSNDLRAWYGEGWWDDPDYGRYRHLGYTIDYAFGLPSLAVAVDFGVTRLSDDAPPATYGTRGPQVLHVGLIDFSRFHVFTDSHSVDEVWTFVPKGDPLPAFFGSLPWDQRCGTLGLHEFEAVAFDLNFLHRCTLPSGLTDSSDVLHTSLPVVWYGESYLRDPHYDEERAHLGWLPAPPEPPSPVGIYTAVDRCVLEPRVDTCTSFDFVTIEVLGPGASHYSPPAPQDGWETEHFRERQGLYVTGPGAWNHDGDGHGWTRSVSLPAGASLPTPTPVCIDAHCP
jgi:hypothetical protein